MSMLGFLRLGTLVLSALPATYIFFRILNSSALVKKGNAKIGGAAAGFVVTLLITSQVFDQRFVPEQAISSELLIGQWEVFNDAEPKLYAVWEFEKATNETLTVKGSVWEARDPTDMRGPSTMDFLFAFGPFPVEYDDTEQIHFNYSSEFGTGSAELALTTGFRGEYRDDPDRTPAEEVDTGGLALYRRNINKQAFILDAFLKASVATLVLSWVSIVLTFLLFKWMKSTALFKAPRLQLAGPFAFFYLFFPLCSTLANVSPAKTLPLFEPELLGTWSMEYLNDRSRYGSVRIDRRTDGTLGMLAHLFRRSELKNRGGIFRTKSIASSIHYDKSMFELSFDYSSPKGVGSAKLYLAPILIGHFLDNAGESQDLINTGNLIGLKRLH